MQIPASNSSFKQILQRYLKSFETLRQDIWVRTLSISPVVEDIVISKRIYQNRYLVNGNQYFS
jgi:spore coat polysaccharide biosynthesis protein SpsF (cytidylyltransferase family)